MAAENLKIDQNSRWVLGAVTNDILQEIKNVRVNPITGALIVEANVTSTNTSIGSTIPGATEGSVLFIGPGGTLAQDNANFFYDDTQNFLGLGTAASPDATLHVAGSVRFDLGADATGDIFYRTVGGDIARLGIGSGGQFLGISGGIPAWASPASSIGYQTIEQDGTPVTQRTILNFVDFFTVSDVLPSTDVTIDVVALGSDSTFVTTIANNATFISQLTGNVTFAGDIISIINAGGGSVQINLGSQVTGVLGATNGGTGQNAVAQGDLLYGSAVNTWARLAKNATATRYLSNTGTSNNPAWAQVDLTNGVTGILPVANIDVAGIANSNLFVDTLMGNNYFTDSLANDPEFIDELTNNATFQTNVNNFVGGGGGIGGTQFLAIAKDNDDSGGNGDGLRFDDANKGRQILHDEANNRIYVSLAPAQTASGGTARLAHMRIFKNDFGNYYQENEITITYTDLPGALSTAEFQVAWGLSSTNLYALVEYADAGGDPGGIILLQYDLTATTIVTTTTIYSIANSGNRLEVNSWDSIPSGGGGTSAQAMTIVGDSMFTTYGSRPTSGDDFVNEFREYDISALPTITLLNTYAVANGDVGEQDRGSQFDFDSTDNVFLLCGLDQNAESPQFTKYQISGSDFPFVSSKTYPEIGYGNTTFNAGDNRGYIFGHVVPTAVSLTIYDVQDIEVTNGSDASPDFWHSWWLETRKYPKF